MMKEYLIMKKFLTTLAASVTALTLAKEIIK